MRLRSVISSANDNRTKPSPDPKQSQKYAERYSITAGGATSSSSDESCHAIRSS
ncbi:hypothetical protein B9Z65_7019 [Elsinoe australis]|uniref:Uncharacterized protein n=1 Tax=Elsinoe australis TaxID=40998 RepID=A0A2P7Z4C2_9PEZI|nr:hypothetical protein B9Z65_7019 [Elsinoe australis]